MTDWTLADSFSRFQSINTDKRGDVSNLEVIRQVALLMDWFTIVVIDEMKISTHPCGNQVGIVSS